MRVQSVLACSGFLIIIVGGWFAWRARRRLVDRRVASMERFVAMAVIFLGFSIGVLGGIRIDGWSIANWLSFAGFIFPALCTGVWLGIALEMRRQQRAASREARPPVESNGAHA